MKNYKYLLIISFLILLVFNNACANQVEMKKNSIGVGLPPGCERLLIKECDYETVILGENKTQYTAVIVNSENDSSMRYDWDKDANERFTYKYFGSEKTKVLIIVFNDSQLLSKANKIIVSDNESTCSNFINKKSAYDIIDLSNMDLINYDNISIVLYDNNDNRINY